MRRLSLSAVMVVLAVLCQAQGLRFQGYDHAIDGRTSLELDLGPLAVCRNSLELSFSYKLFPGAADGYIFRMKSGSGDGDPIINFFCDAHSDSVKFSLILEGKRFLCQLDVPKDRIDPLSGWMRVSLVFRIAGDSVVLTVDDEFSSSGIVDLPDRMKPGICFGKSDYLIDVPSFGMKDLRLRIDGKAATFPFDEDSGNVALSLERSARAIASNPVWLSNDSFHWKRVAQYSSERMLCAGYDPVNHEVYMFNRDSICFLDMVSGGSVRMATAGPCPVVITCASNVLDPVTGTIYAYETFYDEDLDKGKPTFAAFDKSSLGWKALTCNDLGMLMHHHGVVVDTARNAMLLFGGFGNRRFNGDFYEFRFGEARWEMLPLASGDRICPRYFASMGIDGAKRKLYIYGGMGNESGDQVVGREYKYDLHEVDLATMASRKLWEIGWKGDNCVAVRGMVLSGDAFYTLCYPEYETLSSLRLYRFSLMDGTHGILADPIPIYSDKITTNANLYYDEALGKLVATVEESPDDLRSSVKVYTLDFPPRALKAPTVVVRRREKLLVGTVVGALLLAFGLLATIAARVRRKRGLVARIPELIVADADKPNSIYLFGDLTALDRTGEDISARFTTKIRQMFLTIIRNVEDGGVSSKRISSLLWPDKEEEKAKNLRGVTASNLRKFLSEMDGIGLVFVNGKFNFEISEPFHCDYLDFLRVLGAEKPDMDALIGLLSRGKFLGFEDDPMFDKMKSDVERRVESIMTVEMQRRYGLKQYRNVLTCARILFNLDPLNDEALSCALHAYLALGEEEKARLRYQSFITKYKKDYGEDYPRPYESILA